VASVRVDRFGYVRIPPHIARQSYLCLAAAFMYSEYVFVLWLGVVRTSLISFFSLRVSTFHSAGVNPRIKMNVVLRRR
jgi:hypothetical protein